MKKLRRYITTIILLLTLGAQNGAWADVTYHVLTLPFTTYSSTANTILRKNVRVEAIKCTSSETIVGLPSAYQTPLMNSSAYKYYKTVSSSKHETLYGSNNTYYDVYESFTCEDELTAGDAVPEGVTDIYVIYDYDDTDKSDASLSLDLSGGTMYNIAMTNSSTTYFYGAHYKQSWGNRAECVKASNYTSNSDLECLTSNDMVKSSSDNYGRNLGWYLKGNDPYNIRLVTGYTGDAKTDSKHNIKDAFIWAQVNVGAGTSQSMWLYTDTLTNYRNMQHLFVSFVLLNHNNGSDYTMIGSNLNSTWGASGTAVVHPLSNGQYFHLQYQNADTGPRILPVTPANATPIQFYEVRDYTFNVTTPFYKDTGTKDEKAEHTVSATKKWSDYALENYPTTTLTTSDVPDSLKRKYTSFDALYTNYAQTSTISTYEEASSNDYKVYVTYNLGTLPFETLAPGGSYSDATWYELTDKDDSENAKKIAWNGSTTFLNNASDFAKVNEFAFIGDPYELQVIHRSTSEGNTANRYVGAASEGNLGISASADAGYVWEIPYDAVSGSLVLREYKTIKAPNYWKWDASSSGNAVTKASDDFTRIKVIELPKYNYTYNVVDLAGRIAIKATVAQTIFTAPSLPSIIYSPFLSGETVGYYTGTYTDNSGRDKFSSLFNITEVPAEDNTNIWVKYTTTKLKDKPATLSQSQAFNVKLYGEYIYWDSSTKTIKSNASPSNEDLGTTAYSWRLRGRDPYAMIIDNEGANENKGISTTEEDVTVYNTNGEGGSSTEKRYKGVWVQVEGTNWATGTLVFDETTTRANATRFVAKASSLSGVYEVMAATGASVDASTTYYNIGRTSSDGVKMYSNSDYMTGNDELAFILQRSDAKNVTYHLIDHANNELLTVVNRHVSTDAPQFPSDYWSPLVESYYYYASKDQYSYDATNKTKPHTTTGSELSTVGSATNIYVTYSTNDLVDLTANTMYLMEYTKGTSFYAENGGDGIDTVLTSAPFYPYCNGDNNFFVYGQDQYDLQQQGAASTRTRWAWYAESENLDPYHVKIKSRQTSPYNNVDFHAYFHTYQPEDYSAVVTTLTWPGVSGVAATEYMVLGTVGQYQLVTTYGIDLNNDGDKEDEGETTRYVINTFEQYWKTFDTIKKIIFKLETVDESESSTVPATTATEPESEYTLYNTEHSTSLTYRDYLTTVKGYHVYRKWAYAKRWNGYNASGKKSKGWEEIEHWFQTVAVGSGYFDFVETTIDPALILLDQHGWEIMRKPLPTGPDDPDKDEKYAAIRPFNSPMVENYYFWTKSSKRSGCHQYYNLGQQVTVDGVVYTSTSLTDLPPYATAANIKDKNGNLYDQYVTYVAKEEYAYSYDPSAQTGDKFLIQQGSHYVSTSDGSTITKNDVPSGGMTAVIINASASFDNAYLWYLKPNTAIDTEMGYGALNPDWTNDYASDTSTRSGFNSNGFDPYNIQISNAGSSVYFTTNASGATLAEGVFTGTYTSPLISLASATSYVSAEGHDHTTLQITNQTFMAVQDENGNMQLMPRFDHANRMTDFDGLATPQTNPAGDESGTQSTLLFRPYIYNYIIVDNQGRESLRYQSAGELTPQTPHHFQSPLATNFGYYKTLTSTGTGTYNLTTLADSVSSFTKLNMSETGTGGNAVFVRYEYDEDADNTGVLQGKWLTMQLNNLDAKYNEGIINVTKPTPVDNDDSAWQWKFLKNNWTEGEGSYLAPDPYAVELYNRSQKDKPMSATTYSDVAVSAQATGTEGYGYQRFALLSHTKGGYAMAVAGTGLSSGYYFLNGDGGMAASVAAKVSQESSFTSISGTFSDYNSQLLLNNDVENTYTYKVITNAGAFAVESTQTYEEAYGNSFVPTIPTDIQSPLLPTDQYLYYENASLDGSTYTVTDATKITTLYGLYEDYLYVRYNAYNRDNSEYKVPNKRNATGTGQVAVDEDSHDAALDINGALPYNIIWYEDNMMSSDGSTISGDGSQALTSGINYVWMFEGNDPYAIKIKHKNSGKYADGTTTLKEAASAGNFMLLNKDGYDYGVLQVTGDTKKLTGFGGGLTTDAATNPTKFIIFPLSTYSVIYHLVINNIGNSENIYYRPEVSGTKTTIAINGSTKRDLTVETGYPIADKYLLDVSLGDKLEVPDYMYRPNCLFTFYVEGIYDYDSEHDTHTSNTELDNKYQGLKVTHVLDDPDLIGRELKINIVYEFNTGLGTNHGGDFIKDYTENYWFTFDALVSGTIYPAQYTNAWGLKCLEGLDSRYTNDYLWTPVGDPFGFVMYNRYMIKNSNNANAIMTTESLASGQNLKMSDSGSYAAYGIYELLDSSTDGYFQVHPVANEDRTLFVERDASDNYAKLSTTGSEWTFGLSVEQLKPYFDRAGYVGGLKKAVYDENTTLVAAINSGSLTYTQLVAAQQLVYNDDNIVPYTAGYYRLHSQPGLTNVSTPRYASGYLHEIEKTAGVGSTPIPMHFYSKEGVTTTFETLGTGFTKTNATQGQIPIAATEYDPSTIFYFAGPGASEDGFSSSKDSWGFPTSTLQTQGLYASDNLHQRICMSSTSGDAKSFSIMDIGGATLLIHDSQAPSSRCYMCYDQTETDSIYDLKIKHDTPTDEAKWCMEPVNNQGLSIALNSGGDGYYYGTLYVPFDVLLPSTNDVAYVCTAWDSEVLYPKAVGEFNTGDYADNDQYVPAGTPVIIRSTTGTTVTATVPTTSPAASSLSCVFSGAYLEQKLAKGNDVYCFGLPFTSTVTKNEDYENTGEITATAPTMATTGVGFYINANLFKEGGPELADWIPRNNRYVLHNKIYYRDTETAAPIRSAEFIPVDFDFNGIKDLEGHGDEESAAKTVAGDGRVYNMRGQCVATGQEAADGSWMLRVPHGVYILNGKKVLVK